VQARAQITVPHTETWVYAFSRETRSLFGGGLAPGFAALLDQGEANQEPAVRIPYSVVCTCFNEEHTIAALLDSLLHQTAVPAEVIIYDAASTDRTLAVIDQWRREVEPSFALRVAAGDRVPIAQGRNQAAAEAQEQILVFADAGTSLDRAWAERLLAPFAHRPETEVSMGWYRPITRNIFEESAAYFIVPRLDAVNPMVFLPSARSLAVRRDVFTAVGGFPEHLTFAGEDTLFDYYLKTAVKHAAFVPDAIVHWRMPEGIWALARTIYRYARGDAEGGMMFWDYYLKLVDSCFKCALELVLLAMLALFYSMVPGRMMGFLLAVLCLSLVFRGLRLAGGYQPFAGRRLTLVRCLSRLAALKLMLCCQCAGFMHGLRLLTGAERRRIGKAKTGHVVLMSGHYVEYAPDDQRTHQVLQLLQAGWYVTVVYAQTSDMPGAQRPLFAHPQLEQHLRSHFDIDAWWGKHEPYFSGPLRKLSYVDVCNDSLSRSLAGNLEALGASPLKRD